jgi:CUG-BP- and ETR3-like factor
MQQFNDFKLFVGNMPCDVTQDEIFGVFSTFGQLVEVHMMSGTRSRSGQSSAFVKYTNYEDCKEAISHLNLKGKIRASDIDFLSVRFAKTSPSPTRISSPEPQIIGAIFDPCPSFGTNEICTTASSTPMNSPMPSPVYGYRSRNATKVFVGGLPHFIDRDDILAIFSPYGSVQSVHLMSNNRSKSGQSCAFIYFGIVDEASRAIDNLNNKYIVDENFPPVTVRFADIAEAPLTKRNRILAGTADDVTRALAEKAASEIAQYEHGNSHIS